MGVEGLFSKFVRSHSSRSIIKQKPSKIRGLCFDLNGTLHPIAQETFMYGLGCKTEEQLAAKRLKKHISYEELELKFLENLNKVLSDTISYFDPYEFIIIAVDGIPPVGKITLQRNRRLNAYLENTNQIEIPNNDPTYKEKNTPLAKFDITFISPGTPFMERVHNFLLVFVKNHIAKLRSNTIIYTSYKEPGEGEHKIFERLRQPLDLENGYFYNPKNLDATIIWGLDGDLLILATTSPTSSIYMCREDLFQYVDVDSFKKDLIINPKDFCVISNIIGNDFLPKNNIYFSYIQDEVFKAYDKVKVKFESKGNCCLTYEDLEVNINFLFGLFKELAKYEVDLATEVYLYQRTYKGKFYKTSSILERAFDETTKKIDMKKYNEIVIEDLEIIYQINKTSISKSLAYDYVNTMLWMYTYYTKGGKYINWDFTYDWCIAPSISFVMDSIKTPEEFLLNRKKNVFAGESDVDFQSNGKTPFNTGELLLLITPPKLLKNIFDTRGYIEYLSLSDVYYVDIENGVKIYEDGKEARHQTRLILPSINTKKLKRDLMEIYATKIKIYEKENKEKIKEKRIKDFEEKGVYAVNERVLKKELPNKIEYKYRKPLYEKGDYVYFEKIRKPPFMIPSNLVAGESDSDSIIISIKDLNYMKSEVFKKSTPTDEIILKTPEKSSFLKSFMKQKMNFNENFKSEKVGNKF